MASRLQAVVQHQNVRQAVAALREKQEEAVEPVENKLVDIKELQMRIEKIHARSASYRNRQKDGKGLGALTPSAAGSWLKSQATLRAYNVVRSATTVI